MRCCRTASSLLTKNDPRRNHSVEDVSRFHKNIFTVSRANVATVSFRPCSRALMMSKRSIQVKPAELGGDSIV